MSGMHSICRVCQDCHTACMLLHMPGSDEQACTTMQASSESLGSQVYARQAGSRAPRELTRDAEASEGLEGGGGLCLRASSARCCSFSATV